MSTPHHRLISARWVVGFQDGEHRIIEDGVVVTAGDRILHVGRSWDGPADERIDAPGGLLIPGLISTHAHVAAQVGDRLVLDGGRRDFLRSGFLNCAPRKAAGGPGFAAAEDADASIAYAFAALLRQGVTTVVEGGNTGDVGDAMLHWAGESGVRLYYSPAFAAAEYLFESDGRLTVSWDPGMGEAGLARAVRFIEAHDGACDGRIRGIMNPDEFYLSPIGLLRDARAEATRLGVGMTVHFCEQLFEFHETLRRTGRTPVQLMAEHGLLGPDVLLGHCIYIAGHPMTAYPWADDLPLLAASGATVAHAPVALARRGVALASFERYARAGVNLAIGTDSYPYDLLAEMRTAALVGKVVDQDNEAASARKVFDAATLGGARALGRPDLGRLAPGARADMVLLRFDDLAIGPVWDPIRSLVMNATGGHVRHVFVDGRRVVDEGRVLFADEGALVAGAERSCRAVWDRFATSHWTGQPLEAVFTPSLRPWQEP